VIQTWVDACDFGGLSTQDIRGLFWFGPLNPTSKSGVFHVRMLNRVLKRERDREKERDGLRVVFFMLE
jgi:hypothetical protein